MKRFLVAKWVLLALGVSLSAGCGQVALGVYFATTANPGSSGGGSETPIGPTDAEGAFTGATSALLTWTDNAATETGYRIERRDVQSSYALVALLGPDAASFSDTGVDAANVYQYRVQAYNSGGRSVPAHLSVAPPTTAPDAASNLNVPGVDPLGVDLAWTDAADDEWSYRVERAAAPGGPFTVVASLPRNTESYRDAAVTELASYSYRVVAESGAGSSTPSNVVSVLVPAPAPDEPTGLTATAPSSRRVDLAWTDASTNETSFRIERRSLGGSWWAVATVAPNVTSHVDTNSLHPLSTYEYRVIAVNSGSDSLPSNVVQITTTPDPPARPIGLVAETPVAVDVSLSWTDASTNEEGFRIERSPQGAGVFAPVASVAADVTVAADAPPAGAYEYRVVAHNAGGDSLPSDTVVVVVDPIRVLTFAPQSDRVAIGDPLSLGWTLSRTPTSLTLDPGPVDVLGATSVAVTPFPAPPTTGAPSQVYRLSATDAGLTQEIRETGWRRTAGSRDRHRAVDAVVLPDGSLAVVGSFSLPLTLGAGEPNETTLPNSLSRDQFFVARFARTGELLWAKQAGWNGTVVQASRVVALADGSLVTLSIYNERSDTTGPAVYGLGEPNETAFTLPAGDGSQWILARYDLAGSLIWAKDAGNVSTPFRLGVAIVDAGIYLSGNLRDPATFGRGGPNETTLVRLASTHDTFLARFELDGGFAWARIVATPAIGRGFCASSDGHLVLAGLSTPHSVTLSPGHPSELVSPSVAGAVGNPCSVAKFDVSGGALWATRVVAWTSPALRAILVAPDPAGGATLCGSFQNTVTFGLGEPGETVLSTAAAFPGDLFVARFSETGSLRWVKTAAGTQEPDALVSQVDGSVSVFGTYVADAAAPTVFGLGEANETRLQSFGSFRARYRGNGLLETATRTPPLYRDYGPYGAAAWPDGGLVTVGVAEADSWDGLQVETVEPVNWRHAVVRPSGLGWARADTGGVPGAPVEGTSVAAHPSGASTFARAFSGTAAFGDPGDPGQTTLVSSGQRDVALAQRSADGSVLWVAQAGGSEEDSPTAVDAAPGGGSVLVGFHGDAATFGPGEAGQIVLASQGGSDVFVAHYRPDGTLGWARTAGGSGDDVAEAVVVLSDGSSVVAGSFSGTASFGVGEANETTLVSAGGIDVFVARYSADGALTWAKRAGGLGDDKALGVARAGCDVVVAGQFASTATFGPGEAGETQCVSAGAGDAFVARFGTTGDLRWAKRAGGSDDDRATSVAVAVTGVTFVAGSARLSAVFGPGEPGEQTASSSGVADGYVAAYREDGSLIFVRSIGSVGDDVASVVVATTSGALVTGWFQGTTSFGLGEANETVLTSAGAEDLFFAEYAGTGDLVWATRAGGSGSDRVASASGSPTQGYWCTGSFVGSATFGAGETNAQVVGAGPDVGAFATRFFPRAP